MIKKNLLIFLFVFTLNSAFAEEGNLSEDQCTFISIDTSNMPKNNDQTGFKWCSVWSATDLISYNEKIPFASYDVGSQYHLFREDRADDLAKNPKINFSRSAGVPVDALEIILNGKGICREDETNLTNSDWIKLNKIMIALISPDVSPSEVVCEYKLLETSQLKNFSLDVFRIIDKLSGDQKLASFLDVICKRHKLKNAYETHYFEVDEDESPGDIMRRLDGALLSNQPLAVGYAKEMIINGPNFKGKPNHESTIIGRKFNKMNGQCEYLIKNSWGDCKEVESSIKCEDGNYWVTRTMLQNNIDDIQWITPK